MWWWLTVIVSVVCIFDFNIAEKTYAIDESRDLLTKDILHNYHPSSRPGRLNETVILFVNIEIQHFDFRERDGAFHLVGLMNVRWRDPKLVWNPHNYSNLSHITISPKLIWIPDLEVYNNAPDKFIRMHRGGYVTVKNDGVVFWSDSIDVNVFCTTYMKNWPHDKHECSMVFGSWTFDGFEVDIMHLDRNVSQLFSDSDVKNMEYKITKFNTSHLAKYYPCCPNPYITLNYDITFERESSHVVIFRIPALCVILFTLISLRIEPIRTEKLFLNSLSLLLITGQLIYFAQNIGHFTRDTPYIVIFFSTSFVLVTLSQLLGIFSLFATRSSFKGHLPYYVEVVLNSNWTLHLVPIEVKKDRHDDANGQFEDVKLDDTFNLINRNVQSNDWLRLAKLLNSITFIIYALIFLILSTVCFV